MEPEDITFSIDSLELPLFCPPVVPKDLTFTAEIIHGGNYCNLFNPVNGDKGKLLTGIANNYLSAAIEILADGEIPTQAVPITVLIGMSEEGITPYEFIFILAKSNFYAEAEPDTITQGEVSKLIFKRIARGIFRRFNHTYSK